MLEAQCVVSQAAADASPPKTSYDRENAMKTLVLALCPVSAMLGPAFADGDIDAVSAAMENPRQAMLNADKAALERAMLLPF